MPVLFSAGMGVDLRVLTLQLDDVPVTLHYFLRPNEKAGTRPVELSTFFILREIDAKVLRPHSARATGDTIGLGSDKADKSGVEHRTRRFINELCSEHVWTTNPEVRLLKALGLFPLRTPRVALISPTTVIKLLRHFRTDFKALLFEAVLIQLRVEVELLRAFLLTLKSQIYDYNTTHNLSHSNQTSQDLLKACTSHITPYPHPQSRYFASDAPICDTFSFIFMQDVLCAPTNHSIAIPVLSSLNQLPILSATPGLPSIHHPNDSSQSNTPHLDKDQFAIAELEQLLQEINFDSSLVADNCFKINYHTSKPDDIDTDTDPHDRQPQLQLLDLFGSQSQSPQQSTQLSFQPLQSPPQSPSLPPTFIADLFDPMAGSFSPTPTATPRTLALSTPPSPTEHRLPTVLNDVLVTPVISSTFSAAPAFQNKPHHRINFEMQRLNSSTNLPVNHHTQYIQPTDIPVELQFMTKSIQLGTQSISLGLLPPRFAPSFNIDICIATVQKQFPLSLLAKQKDNIIKNNAHFIKTYQPERNSVPPGPPTSITHNSSQQPTQHPPNHPQSTPSSQNLPQNVHFPLTYKARPTSIYDLNALIYHHFSNILFMQPVSHMSIDSLMVEGLLEYWLPFPQNPSCVNCKQTFTDYTARFGWKLVDFASLNTIQSEYQSFMPCLCRLDAQNEKYLSQYLENGDPELTPPAQQSPDNPHSFKSFLYGDPALLSWPSIVPFALLISLALSYYQQRVLFTLMTAQDDESGNAPTCPLDGYDLSQFNALSESQQQSILIENSFKWLLQNLKEPLVYSTALVELDSAEIVAALFPDRVTPLVYLVPDKQCPEHHWDGDEVWDENGENRLIVDPTVSFTQRLVADVVQDTNLPVLNDVLLISSQTPKEPQSIEVPHPDSAAESISKPRKSTTRSTNNNSTQENKDVTSDERHLPLLHSNLETPGEITHRDPYGHDNLLFPLQIHEKNIGLLRSCAYHLDILPPTHRFRLFRHAHAMFPIAEDTQLLNQRTGRSFTAAELRQEQQNGAFNTSQNAPSTTSPPTESSPDDIDGGQAGEHKKKSTRGRKSLQHHLDNGTEPHWARAKLRKLKREMNNHATVEELTAVWRKEDAPNPQDQQPQTAPQPQLPQTDQRNAQGQIGPFDFVQLTNTRETNAVHPTDFHRGITAHNPHRAALETSVDHSPTFHSPAIESHYYQHPHQQSAPFTAYMTPPPTSTPAEELFMADLLPQPLGIFDSLFPTTFSDGSDRFHNTTSQPHSQTFAPSSTFTPAIFLDSYPYSNYSTATYTPLQTSTSAPLQSSPPDMPLNHQPVPTQPTDQFSAEFTRSFLEATLPIDYFRDDLDDHL